MWEPRAEVERTVIIYMAGDNSLGDATNYNAIPLDTVEMAKSKALIPEDVNFIIFVDDKQHKPAIYELSRESGIRLWKQYEEELCTTDSEVMLDILRTIEHYFPARHYGITLWSHASGWAPERKSSRQKTFGKDETGSTSGKYEMEIPVLHNVLAQLPKFDYIFFDACFMQSIEVAYELRDVTNYMIGSPAEIPGPGAPYDIIIEALCKSDVEGIIRGYDSAYPVGPYTGVLLSCIDCTKLDALAEITGQLLTPYYMGRTQASTTDFQPYCYDMTYYTHLKKYTFCFDMRTTMRKLLKEEGEGNEEKYATWMETFDQAVPLRTLSDSHRWFAQYCSKSIVLDPTCYGGVSMFVPMNAYNGFGWNEDFQKTSWYEATGWAATGW